MVVGLPKGPSYPGHSPHAESKVFILEAFRLTESVRNRVKR